MEHLNRTKIKAEQSARKNGIIIKDIDKTDSIEKVTKFIKYFIEEKLIN